MSQTKKYNAESEVNKFIKELEVSAKKILKDASRKKKEETRIEQAMATRKLYETNVKSKTPKGIAHNATVMMTSTLGGASSSFNKGQNKLLAQDSYSTLSSIKNQNNLEETHVMHYSVPRMVISMADSSDNYDHVLRTVSAGNSIQGCTSNCSVQLSPIRGKSSPRHYKSDEQSTLDTLKRQQKRSKILERIETSPYIPSNGNFTSVDILNSKDNSLNKQKQKFFDDAPPVEESNFAMKMRATAVLSGKAQSNTAQILQKQQKTLANSNQKLESQGAVDWSSNAIRAKYRGESARESIWLAWSEANEYANMAINENDLVLPVAAVDRHPIYRMYYRCLETDNIESQARSQARLKMKRFVLDVQEIWLTNLPHLREHQSAAVEAEIARTIHSTSSGVSDETAGLDNRRDTKAIAGMSSQIPSVSDKRAVQKAFYTARMPDPTVVLHHVPPPTATLPLVRPEPPLLETLLEGFHMSSDKLRGQAPSTPPVLLVHRLLPPSTSSTMSTKAMQAMWRISILCQETATVTSATVLESEIQKLVSSTWGESADGIAWGMDTTQTAKVALLVAQDKIYGTRVGECFLPSIPGLALTDVASGAELSHSDIATLSTQLLAGVGDRRTVDLTWETMSESPYCMSLYVSGGMPRLRQVPGSCEIGRGYGPDNLCFTPTATEVTSKVLQSGNTRASAIYFRDAKLSSSDSVLVRLTVAMDSPCLIKVEIAWETASISPDRSPHEDPLPHVSQLIARPTALLAAKLISPLDPRMSVPAAIVSTIAEEGTDYPLLSQPRPPAGLVRAWPFVEKYGFRRRIQCSLLGVDAVLPTQVFGLTKTGATPNTTSVQARNVWHSTVLVTGDLTKHIVCEDLHYVIKNECSRGCNDPAIFTIHLRHIELFDLRCSAFKDIIHELDEIGQRRGAFAKQFAMEAKIENAEVQLRAKEALLEMQLRRRAQRDVEKRLNKVAKSEKGWRRRMQLSTVVEVQGNWERRRDDRNGMYFFHFITDPSAALSFSGSGNSVKREEKMSDTCRWTVPETWDGDPLADGSSGIKGAEEAFTQPSETWLPGDDEGTEGERTSGVEPRPMQRSKQGDVLIGTDAYDRKMAEMGSDKGATEEAGEGSVPVAVASSSEDRDRRVQVALLRRLAGSSSDLLQLLASKLGVTVADGETDTVLPVAEQLDANGVGSGTVVSFGGDEGASALSVARGGCSVDESHDTLPAVPRSDVVDADDLVDDSDDDVWSDDEGEAGDAPAQTRTNLSLPQDHGQVAALRKKAAGIELLGPEADKSMLVPFLNMETVPVVAESRRLADLEAAAKGDGGKKGVRGEGWRRLAKPNMHSNFLLQCTATRTMAADIASCNSPNSPLFMAPLSPVDACIYEPYCPPEQFECLFIRDAKKDVERVLALVDHNIQQEELLSQPLSTAQLLQTGRDDTGVLQTSVTAPISNYAKGTDKLSQNKEKAILACKSSNLAQLEDALDEDVSVETTDSFGNTLLILAAQQGSKRLCKFLLRRGANINAQSRIGNTSMHYCHAYSHKELAAYLKSKGADDSLLNFNGLTCYEGLSADETNV